jgi:hypothetical protein
VAPPPPPPTLAQPPQSPVTTKGPSGQGRVGFVLAGLALLVIAVRVVGRLALVPPLQAFLVSVAIVIIGVTTAVRSGESGARKVMFVSAMVLVLFASGWVAAGVDQLLPGKGSAGGVAGSSNGGHTSPGTAPPTPTSGYTWAQLAHVYPGLSTPCNQQPNAAGKLQCYWSHYSNAASAEPSAKELSESALRGVLLTDFDFYHKNYAAVSGCTTVNLTTDFECIAGAQTLDGYDTEIASIIERGLSSQ